MKRRVFAALLAGAMALSLAACGSGGSDSSSGGGDSAAGGDEHTLTLFAWDPNFNIPAMEAAGADYKKNVDPDFNLEVIEQSASEDVETAIYGGIRGRLQYAAGHRSFPGSLHPAVCI